MRTSRPAPGQLDVIPARARAFISSTRRPSSVDVIGRTRACRPPLSASHGSRPRRAWRQMRLRDDSSGRPRSGLGSSTKRQERRCRMPRSSASKRSGSRWTSGHVPFTGTRPPATRSLGSSPATPAIRTRPKRRSRCGRDATRSSSSGPRRRRRRRAGSQSRSAKTRHARRRPRRRRPSGPRRWQTLDARPPRWRHARRPERVAGVLARTSVLRSWSKPGFKPACRRAAPDAIEKGHDEQR